MKKKDYYMVDLFWIQLLLSFIVGSVWVTLTTIMAERFGSKIGGFIGGLPSSTLVALLFIGWTQTPEIASQATTVMPLIIGFGSIFLVAYAIASKRNFITGLIAALSTWFVLSALVVVFKIENFAFSIFAWLLTIPISYYILEKKVNIKSYGKIKVTYTLLQIIGRAILSGLIIAFAVFMGKFGGPIFGGIFSVFPAIYTSTLIITYNSGGVEFSRAIAKSLMLNASITIIAYTIAVRYFYLISGLLLGTTIAYAISTAVAYLTYVFINKRMK